jgi:hypothetical protein
MFEKLRSMSRIGWKAPDHPLADSRELRRVIDEIPADNSFRALDEIVVWLESLRAAADFPLDRLYEAVSRLDDAAQPSLRRLAKDYLHSPRLSAAEEKRLWSINHDFWTLLAASYERCLQVPGQKTRADEQLKQILPALSVRLIAALGSVGKWERFHYGVSAGILWQRLGAVMRLAEEGGVASRATRLHEGASGMTSPQQEFVKIVAFHAASLDSLLPLEIELTERLIAHFASAFYFSPVAEHDCVYWVDLAQGEPPTRLARMPSHALATLRFFKPAAAYSGIAGLLDDVEQGRDMPAAINLGGQYPVRTLLSVLHHLAAYLAPVPPQRRHDRYNVKQRALIAPGLKNACQALSGHFASPEAAGHLESWVVENVSRGGFGAALNNLPAEWLKVGALVAMQPQGGTSWLLAIVRRYYRQGESEARVGIETLALNAEPLEVRTRTNSTYSATARITALLLDDGGMVGEVRLLLPFATFDLREMLQYEQAGRRFELSPVAIVEQCPDYELARYRLSEIV